MSDDIKTCRHRVCTVEINGECMCTAEKYQAILADKEKENERLRGALEIYANKDNWTLDDWNIKAVFGAPYGGSWVPAEQALKDEH